MYSLRRFGIKLGLSTIKRILQELGDPQNKFACIHIAGSNGKGSVASALSLILHSAGYNVGLYTSPHLVRFNERICINNEPVSDEDVVDSYKAVKSVHYGEREPTFFEFATAMALYEFSKHKVDWAVIETGMGGRLDATNVIMPSVSVITNISLEHVMYLGNTIVEIAGEKGGIIKKERPVVTGVKQEEALSALEEIANEKSAPFYNIGNDFRAIRNKDEVFTYYGIDNTWRDMRTGLSGNYQVDNAALVLACCELLNRNDSNIPLQSIKDGLEKNRWPGRLELVSTSPYILLDGAHNLIAARNLGKFLSTNLADREIILVVGILDDKPYASMLRSLVPICSRVILTQVKNERALPADKLYQAARKMNQNITVIPDVAKALRHALETASDNDAVCVAGSLYVVGEAKEELEKSGFNSFQLK
ncbi:MAG: bifunctional folylpolyglutamate synthase/dihydrofolate synthase [Desulfobacteraceae bacterium]|nr:bifunctional folylpolyglutamate synthase/dihydrofolate synthase [Desulfobacteraceae bacterium]